MAAPDPHALSRQTWADYLDILRRRRRVALFAGLLVVAGGASFALGLPALYQASATILVQGAMRQSVADQPAAGEIDARLQAIKQEALSRARLTDLITRFNLYPRLRNGSSLEPALDQIQRDIRVENTSSEAINGQTSTIAFKLTYVGNDAQTTADVTNALASFYVAQNTRSARSRPHSRPTRPGRRWRTSRTGSMPRKRAYAPTRSATAAARSRPTSTSRRSRG